MKIFGKDCGCDRRRQVMLEWMLDHPTIIRAACAVVIAAGIALYVLGDRTVQPAPYVNQQTCVFSSEDTGSQLGNVCSRLDPATKWALRQRI